MTVDTRTLTCDPGAVVVLRRTSRLLAKAALVVEEDADRWAVYVATGAANGSDFWRAAVEKTEAKAAKLARDMMDGRAWPKEGDWTGDPAGVAQKLCGATRRDEQELGVPSANNDFPEDGSPL